MVTDKKPNGEDATMRVILSEAIEEFMASVPGDPQEAERNWSSDDMAAHLLKNLDVGGYVLFSVEPEMPTMSEEIIKIALELIANGADVYTAGAGAMWEAVLQKYFKKELNPVDENRQFGMARRAEIDKAIEIIEELPDNVNNVLDYDQQNALKLGIEVLKREQKDRQGTFTLLLPEVVMKPKFYPGDSVSVRNYRLRPPMWECGQVLGATISWRSSSLYRVSYEVLLDRLSENGRRMRLYVCGDDVRAR